MDVPTTLAAKIPFRDCFAGIASEAMDASRGNRGASVQEEKYPEAPGAAATRARQDTSYDIGGSGELAEEDGRDAGGLRRTFGGDGHGDRQLDSALDLGDLVEHRRRPQPAAHRHRRGEPDL